MLQTTAQSNGNKGGNRQFGSLTGRKNKKTSLNEFNIEDYN